METVAPDLDESSEAASESTNLVSSNPNSEYAEQSKSTSVLERIGPAKEKCSRLLDIVQEKWSRLPNPAKAGIGVAGLLIVVFLIIMSTSNASTSTNTPAPPAPEDICEDTCQWANDESCDDGGDDSEYSVCAKGTDCQDCGKREVNAHNCGAHGTPGGLNCSCDEGYIGNFCDTPCGDHASVTNGACQCDDGFLNDPANDHRSSHELGCRSCGPHGTFTLTDAGVRTCVCEDTGAAEDNYEGQFCDLPPGLHVSGAVSHDGTEAQINGNYIDGPYDRHEETKCNGMPVYEHSGTFGTSGDGVVIFQPDGHDGEWYIASGEAAEEGDPLCEPRGVFMLCSTSSPMPGEGMSYAWKFVQGNANSCYSQLVVSIDVTAMDEHQNGF